MWFSAHDTLLAALWIKNGLPGAKRSPASRTSTLEAFWECRRRMLRQAFECGDGQTLEGMPLDRIRANGYVFLVEMAYLAYCLEYRIGELPIYFAERRSGQSKMSFRIQVEAALRVGFVRWNLSGFAQGGKASAID